MLIHIDEIMPFLICPRTGRELRIDSAGRFSTIDSSASYSCVGQHPVLVDFSASLLDEKRIFADDGESAVKRRKRTVIESAAKRLVAPSPTNTDANVSRFIQLLRDKTNRPLVLVIGGGTLGVGMNPLYDELDIRLIAFDIYASPKVQFIADGHDIPLADSVVDGVVVQAVLEHVLEPQRVVKEIARVLKRSGVVYAETPFMQHVHEGAYDFTRFSESGHRYLFREFQAISSGPLHGAADQLMRSVDYFFRSLFRSVTVGKLAKLAIFWIKYFDHIIPKEYAVDAASSVYFLGRKSEKPMSGVEIVDYYQGAQG